MSDDAKQSYVAGLETARTKIARLQERLESLVGDGTLPPQFIGATLEIWSGGTPR